MEAGAERTAGGNCARADSTRPDCARTVHSGAVTDDRARLIDLIRDEAVFRGDFTLTSGKHADFYIDLRKLSLDHRAAPLIGRVLLDLVDEFTPVDAVGGLTLGAAPIAPSGLHERVAREGALDAFIVRKAPKDHGRGRQIEGAER